jgi:formylglycine-generating enzyme required for sulfatase activity
LSIVKGVAVSRIFLSHSRANNAEAIAIRDWMIAHGWDDVFLDLDPERGLKAGERWQEALKRAAERCELVVFLVSPVWAASKWCLAEFLLAKSLNKRVFAVIVEPTPFSELPIEMTAEWQITDLTAGPRDFHVTVTLPGGKTTDVALGTEGLGRLRIGLVQSGLDPKNFPWPPTNDPDRTPYRGLLPFEADDAGIFFAREAPVIDALDRLRGLREAPPPRLLVILGASGAGKSSFLRAGLLPRLARDDRQFLALPIIRPERVAISGETGLLRALEGAFRTAHLSVARADLRAAIEGGATKLGALLSMLAQKATPAAADPAVTPKAPTLVLSIDQGEELFQAEGQQEAQPFLALLRDLVTADAPAVIALFTIRSDNYERLQLAKEMEGVRQQTLSLPPMPKGSYAEVIKGPARRLEGTPRALRIDDAVVDALLADIEAGGAKDALPLLAFTLERLYGEYGATGHLKLDHYEKLGRIEGSIEAAVEGAFRAADADPKVPKDKQARVALLRRGLIPWLAGIDPETGAPRRRVARLSEIPAEARPLIDLLIEQRLLSTDVATGSKETTIEPAHEALLRQWGLLRGWLAEDAGLLGVLEGVKRASRDWAANGKTPAWLTHATGRLEAAQHLRQRADLAASLKPTDHEYLAACWKEEAAARSRTRRVRALICVLLVGIIAGLVGWINEGYVKERMNWYITMRPYRVANVDPYVLKPEAERALKPLASFRECAKDCPEMIVIPAGSFAMGSPITEKGRHTNEGPQRTVTIAKPFAVSKFDVTFDEWEACVSVGGCPQVSDSGFGRGTRPVINVSWDEAQQYVAWFCKMTGRPYRLLTEAEWEYAARAGATTAYIWGDEIGKSNANCRGCGSQWDNRQTAPVGSFAPNGFGLYDMTGNVWQWVQDCYRDNYDGAPTDGSALTVGDCSRRAARGGSWNDDPLFLRSAVRDGAVTADRDYHGGFRLGRTLTP